jgi:hypothetical protein
VMLEVFGLERHERLVVVVVESSVGERQVV